MSTSLPIHEPLSYQQPIFDRAKHDRAKRSYKKHPVMPRAKQFDAPILTWRTCVGCGADAKLCPDCARVEAAEHGVRAIEFPFLAQVWRCCTCGTPRAWGENKPMDDKLRPALNCDRCEVSTRHRFLRVA